MTGFPTIPPRAPLSIAGQGQEHAPTSTNAMPRPLSAASSHVQNAPPSPRPRSPTSALITSRLAVRQRIVGRQTGALKERAEKELRRLEEVEELNKIIAKTDALLQSGREDKPARPPDDYLAQLFLEGFKRNAVLSPCEGFYVGMNAKELASLAWKLDSFLAGAPANALAQTLDQASPEALQLLVRHPWVQTQTKETIQKELDNRHKTAGILINRDIPSLFELISTETGALKELAEKELCRREEVEPLIKKQAEVMVLEDKALSLNNQDNKLATVPADYLEKLFFEGFKRDATLSPDERFYAETNIEELTSLACELESLRLGAQAETLNQVSSKALQLLHGHPWVRMKTKETIQDELDKRAKAAAAC